MAASDSGDEGRDRDASFADLASERTRWWSSRVGDEVILAALLVLLLGRSERGLCTFLPSAIILARLSRRSILSSEADALTAGSGCWFWFRLRLDIFCPNGLLGSVECSASRTIVGYEAGLSLGMAVASWFGMRRGSVRVWLAPVNLLKFFFRWKKL